MIEYNRIYAYTTLDVRDKEWEGPRKGRGLIKVGQTSRTAEERIKAQLQGSPNALKDGYTILLDEEALDLKGEYFRDIDLFKWLKIMGVYRIPKTEWFECRIEEVREAFNNVVLRKSGRTRSYKRKDTAENRGHQYNKKEAERERRIFERSDSIVQVMSLYTDSTSILKISRNLVKHYDIKQYSVSSAYTYIAKTVNKLIEIGCIRNLGSKSFPNLKLINSSVSLIESEDTRPTLDYKQLKSLIDNIKDGLTYKDIESRYQVKNKSYLYEILDKDFIKVKTKVNGRTINRYVSPKNFKVEENNNESNKSELLTSTSYTEKDVLELKKWLKGKCKLINSRNLYCTTVCEQLGLTIHQLRKIVEDNFLKLIVYETTSKELILTYKAHSYIKKDIKKKKKIKLKTHLNTLEGILEGCLRGLTCQEVQELTNWNKTEVFRTIKEARKDNRFYKCLDRIILSKYPLDPFLQKLPSRCFGLAFRYGITKQIFIDIIRDNPYCHIREIGKILLDRLQLSFSDGYFDELVAAVKRELIKEGIVVQTSKRGSLHIKNEQHCINALPKFCSFNITELLEYLEQYQTGATTQEVYSFFKGSFPYHTLLPRLKNEKNVKYLRVHSLESEAIYYYKWFSKNQPLCLEEHEDLFEAIQFIKSNFDNT